MIISEPTYIHGGQSRWTRRTYSNHELAGIFLQHTNFERGEDSSEVGGGEDSPPPSLLALCRKTLTSIV